MPSKNNVVDEGEDLDFDPEFDNSAGIDDYLFDEEDYRLMFTQIGDQDLWKDHSTNKCQISFCSGITRPQNEGKTEIKEMKQNIRNVLKKEVNEEVSRHNIVELFYGKYSNLYRDFHDKLLWSHTKFLMFVKT